MDPSQPLYLQGRGRGRGRTSVGRGNQPGSNPFFQQNTYPQRGRGYNRSNSKENTVPHNAGSSEDFTNSTEGSASAKSQRQYHKPQSPKKILQRREVEKDAASGRFEEVAAQHHESVQRHLSRTGSGGSNEEVDYQSSSEEEDLEEDEIFDSVLKSFKGTIANGEVGNLGRTQEYILNSVKSKANVCLICIETIKRHDAIWGCDGCYTTFHISCIQKWVKDGVYQQTALSDENFPNRDLPWFCPKCRHEYKQSQCPSRYYCFCGKEEDPKFDPWLVPHSCGQTCGRKLKPECGHECLLLCHPGPCPPCPQTVRMSCYCKKQPPQTRRCGAKEWSCGQPCEKDLPCDHHVCKTPCHPGECPVCPEKSMQTCMCDRNQEIRPCAKLEWHCEEKCGKAFECDNHTCEVLCHAGPCGDCPRSGKRTCPCSKSVFEAPCTEDVPTCHDTCDKTLECGLHECTQRCHYGPCGTCREMIEKKCRCGQRKKEIQCYKEYTCETKCSKMKDCSKHPCKRKCCDGKCPPCEQQCNKTLGCKNHKCSSRCHRGQCYPCPLTVQISCGCGATSLSVPCGREKVTKPPKCSEPCKNPPDCHHPSRIPHKCHFNACPPCRQICGKSFEKCNHTCPAMCHSAVRAKIQEKVERAGPWVPKPEARIETVEKQCPPCIVPVPTTCLGEHETVPMSCSTASVGSCARRCGRRLACMNHTCTLECHKVLSATDKKSAGRNCKKCEEPCTKPRPEGCSHPCILPCHSGECPPCNQMIRMRCHCSLVVQHIECDQWIQGDDWHKQRLKACPSRCPKTLSCGHQCTSKCHQGACATSDRCTEKVKVRCPCKRKKQEYLCNEIQIGIAKVECDEYCVVHKEKSKKQADVQEKEKIAEELKRQQAEVEEFERKIRGRKRKPRKQRIEEEDPTFLEKHRKLLVAAVITVMIAIIFYYLWTDVEIE